MIADSHELRAADHLLLEEADVDRVRDRITNTNTNTNANGHMNFQPRQSALCLLDTHGCRMQWHIGNNFRC